MEITYKELDENTIEKTNADGSLSWIPKDLGNSDYQVYLNQLTESSN